MRRWQTMWSSTTGDASDEMTKNSNQAVNAMMNV
jgi:hypothetical protein